MDFAEPFSVLNEKLRPARGGREQLYSSLSRLQDRDSKNASPESKHRGPTPPRITIVPPESDPEGDESDDGLSLASGDTEDSGNGGAPAGSDELAGTEDVETEERGEGDDPDPDQAACPRGRGTRDGEDLADSAGEGRSPFVRTYADKTLPDLVRSGRPLRRRRTVSHVSDSLKEVHREMELSRRRSIKLKAQVDRLQESREGPGWSQSKDRVTEEVLLVLHLLNPMTNSSFPEPPRGPNCLDVALSQLQLVARKLAVSHTKSESKSGPQQCAVLQQALRERDDAIERKRAMEEELLRSRTEMMLLNNQLLDSVKKCLDLTLELEACKEDIQVIIHQQVLRQQQAEQNQRKPKFSDMFKKNIKPGNPPTSAPATTNSNQIFMPKAHSGTVPIQRAAPSPNGNRTWKDKMRIKGSRHRDLESVVQDMQKQDADGFQVISLD